MLTVLENKKTLEDIRSEKSSKFKELIEKGVKKGTKEYETHFLRYIPLAIEEKKLQNMHDKNQTKKGKRKKAKKIKKSTKKDKKIKR